MREPYIGANYPARRILILGESSYGIGDMGDGAYVVHWLDHPNFVEHPQCKDCARVGGPEYKRDPLNDRLTAMMIGKPGATDAERRAAWSNIAFTNFMVRELADRSEGERPTEREWEDAARQLPAVLDRLNPELCCCSTIRPALSVASPLP